MMEIVKYPDDRLNAICEPITDFNNELEDLFHKMKHAMIENNGIGLAAPQVGVLKRLMLVAPYNMLDPIAMVNPVITMKTELQEFAYESCLSIPNKTYLVGRPVMIDITFQGINGKEISLGDVTGLFARVIQHELDHLDGILINRGKT